jgi:hypothetical protein
MRCSDCRSGYVLRYRGGWTVATCTKNRICLRRQGVCDVGGTPSSVMVRQSLDSLLNLCGDNSWESCGRICRALRLSEVYQLGIVAVAN